MKDSHTINEVLQGLREKGATIQKIDFRIAMLDTATMVCSIEYEAPAAIDVYS